MIDHRIRPLIDPVINRVASIMSQWGVSPNQITITGFIIGLLGAVFIAFHLYLLGLALILFSRVADGLDGALARATKRVSDRGGFLDITLDFIFYSSIPFAFALANPAQNALPAAFLIWSFIGTASSFLAYAIVAEKRCLSINGQGEKSLFYLGGLTEGFETIVFLSIICLIPQFFPVLSYGFACLAWITTGTRIYAGWVHFKDQSVSLSQKK